MGEIVDLYIIYCQMCVVNYLSSLLTLVINHCKFTTKVALVLSFHVGISMLLTHGLNVINSGEKKHLEKSLGTWTYLAPKKKTYNDLSTPAYLPTNLPKDLHANPSADLTNLLIYWPTDLPIYQPSIDL